MAVSSVFGGHRSTRRKQPSCNIYTYGTIRYDSKYGYRKYAVVVRARMLLFHDSHFISLFVKWMYFVDEIVDVFIVKRNDCYN